MNTEKSQSIPESLTIGGTVYKVAEHPELKEFIGQIAKVEKSKLYTTIEELRTNINELSKVQVVTPESPAPQAQQPQGLTAEQIAQIVSATIQKEIAPLQASIQQTQSETLEEYRERLIKDNEHLCIPEMVKGNSREELLASLQESVAVRNRFSPSEFSKPGGLESQNVPPHVAEAAQQAQTEAVLGQVTQTAPAPQTQPQHVAPVQTAPAQTAPAQTAPVAPTNTQVISPMGAPAITEDNGLSSVKNMSPEEFAANRKKLEEKLKTVTI